jgi:peptide subunit release factor 1 (eRF1)
MEGLVKQYELIKEYAQFSGSQTSMATLYITPDKNLVTI